ncbi:MAG: tyrosine-type recombinase/integrase [Actinomycetota bacterium]
MCTVRKSFNALSQMMRAAVADRRIPLNPCQGVPLPPERHVEQRFLMAREVEALADAIEPRFRALVLLAAYGGLRFGELAGLRRSKLDPVRGRVQVAESLVEANGQLSFGPPKSKRSLRSVPLPRRIASEAQVHLEQYVSIDPDSLVFTGPKGGALRRAGFRRSWWRPAIKAAGLPGLKFHELRHTFVAMWVAAGADPKEVSVRAGHSSVAFTLDRYGHLYHDAEDDILERLDALLFESLVRISRGPTAAPPTRVRSLPTSSSLLTCSFTGWPQRDLNPCYRLERSERSVSSIFEPY